MRCEWTAASWEEIPPSLGIDNEKCSSSECLGENQRVDVQYIFTVDAESPLPITGCTVYDVDGWDSGKSQPGALQRMGRGKQASKQAMCNTSSAALRVGGGKGCESFHPRPFLDLQGVCLLSRV